MIDERALLKWLSTARLVAQKHQHISKARKEAHDFYQGQVVALLRVREYLKTHRIKNK